MAVVRKPKPRVIRRPARERPRKRILRATLDSWWCPFCSRANGSQKGSCDCGATRVGDEAEEGR